MMPTKLRTAGLAAVALLLAGADVQGAEAHRARPRKIFAHHMGCYPVGAAATAHHRMNDAHKVRHDGTRQHDAYGDRWRNWPLVPDGTKLSLEASADLEIRRALRGGIDGFAIDAWAGRDDAKRVFSALIKVAEKKGYPFEVTICLDAGIQSNQGLSKSIQWVLEHHGDSPKLARRDGKLLIFGYLSVFPGFRHGAQVLKQKERNRDKDIKELFTDSWLRATPQGWDLMAKAHEQMERDSGRELYWHYCMSAFFHQVPGNLHDADKLVEAAAFMAGRFDAVGEFLGGGEVHDRMAAAVRAKGAEWSQPLYFQYENIGWGGNRIGNGADILRRCWRDARKNGSTLIQFVTWSDYTENTSLAPAYETRYAITDLNHHFIHWWKTGKEPTSDHDKIYLIYRKYPKGATFYPFKAKRKDSGGVIEVLTILPAPAKLRLVGRDAEWHAPAGMSHRQFPLSPGPVVAELLRDGQVVTRLESPEPITDRPFREQNGMTCFSTEFERHWRADFGEDVAPLLRGEYADSDKDGLPNWFEMYWFGKFLDYSTATVADPDADPDRDGKSNLEEYRAQTDPTRPPRPSSLR
ncbi:MAG: hypothetical protein ISS72_08350 [Candidatus Brocadiae bacterium]|nr:hypothetical protein [Candidatus Brocadiia bacterium]